MGHFGCGRIHFLPNIHDTYFMAVTHILEQSLYVPMGHLDLIRILPSMHDSWFVAVTYILEQSLYLFIVAF